MKNKRPLKNRISDILPNLYEILLLVENDEEDYSSGCSWTYVKSKKASCDIIDKIKNGKKFLIVETDINKEKIHLEMIKGDKIASDFIRNARNSFAHNRMSYDPVKRIITFEDNKLNGSITLEAFDNIIKLIKESKILKSKSNKNEKK